MLNFSKLKIGRILKLKWIQRILIWLGVVIPVSASVEMAAANKRNKRAERIKANAIKKHNEGREKVETTLAALGETKLTIYKRFGELADAIESIQQRPDYKFSIEGIESPNFKPGGRRFKSCPRNHQNHPLSSKLVVFSNF